MGQSNKPLKRCVNLKCGLSGAILPTREETCTNCGGKLYPCWGGRYGKSVANVLMLLAVFCVGYYIGYNNDFAGTQLFPREKAQLVSEKDTSESQIAKLMSQETEWKSQIETLKKEKTQLASEKDASESKIAKLMSQIETLQKEKVQLASEKDAAKSQIAKLLSQIETTEKEKARLVSKIEKLEEENARSVPQQNSRKPQLLPQGNDRKPYINDAKPSRSLEKTYPQKNEYEGKTIPKQDGSQNRPSETNDVKSLKEYLDTLPLPNDEDKKIWEQNR